MKQQILNNLEKLTLVYESNLEEYWSNINGQIYVKGDPMPDDKEEAEKWLAQLLEQ